VIAVRTTRRILLAEDNPVNQRVATAMLEHLGFHVHVVSDGAEAVRAAILTPYQAILMDCDIPGLDGYQATSEIRRLQGTSRGTPIIAVTASPVESVGQSCLAAGMDDCLSKPLTLKALATVLDHWAPDGSRSDIADEWAEPLPDAGRADAADRARPVLDARVVGRLERLGNRAGEDLMEQLAVLFLTNADARVNAMRKALSRDDAGAVVRSAHTLSGASANLGATELARLCATLATDGAAGDPAGGGVLVQEIEAELERVRHALDSRTPAR